MTTTPPLPIPKDTPVSPMSRQRQDRWFRVLRPASMTDRTWHLWWIAVAQTQAKGVGGELLRHVEDSIRQEGGRLLLIETSSLASYQPTRRFYLKHHYQNYAVLADFYGDGHDMVIFSKRLQ